MTHYYSLLSVVFMICFVFMFDRMHQHRCDAKFCAFNLLGAQDVDRIRQILAACQDS